MNSPQGSLAVRDLYAHKILQTYHERIAIPDPGPALPDQPDTEGGPSSLVARSLPTVGIIGAGAAGLYAAMILQDLGLKYDILEANRTIGGRLFTHRFSSGPNDYYDVGAMRFPDIPLMSRTFDLFKRLKFTDKTVIPYYLSTPHDIQLFNGYLFTGTPPGQDPFHVSISNGGNVPDSWERQGYSNLIEAKLGPFKQALATDFETGWKRLMHYDKYSTRMFMSLTDPQYPTPVIDWLETMDSATGLYDYAFSESVMDSLDFDYPTKPPVTEKWYCIQGGAEVIATAMAQTLAPHARPVLNKRVTNISPATSTAGGINVLVDGEPQPRPYGHVISTVPLSCLRMVNTDSCNLSYALKTAMRALHYDSSVKVGIKFTDRWWEPLHKGGVSSTDRPTRVVVYPSYGIGGGDATMICSYAWAQDAMRLGALVHGSQSSSERLLVKLVIQDLAVMHSIPYKTLMEKVVAYHAFNWYGNEYSCGAFALFGPGQFSNLYQEVTQPAAGGLLHFAGEATSVHHAWVAGALNSAYRCVLQILVHENLQDLITKLRKNWGTADEIRLDLLRKQVLLGRMRSAPTDPEV